MENNITLITQLSLDDQIRIDKLTSALNRVAQCLEAGCNLQTVTHDEVLIDEQQPGQMTMAETVAELPQMDAEPVEQVQTPQEPETLQDESTTAETATPAPSVTKQDILQKVIALCNLAMDDQEKKGLKDKVANIITTYADCVSDLPETALDEVWDKLTALEG